MHYTPTLIPGTLLKRYKRFLADIRLDSGETITAHCPNTGSMRNCMPEHARVWVQPNQDPKRKLAFTWELVETAPNILACINTHRANALVKEAIRADKIAELKGYTQLLSEQRYGAEKSRIDLLLKADNRPDCYIEVKNVTLHEQHGVGAFPDAVTARGTKHLRELTLMAQAGARAVLFFHVAHTGIQQVTPAAHIDPVYAQSLADALNAGVEVLAYQSQMDAEQILLARPVPFSLHP